MQWRERCRSCTRIGGLGETSNSDLTPPNRSKAAESPQLFMKSSSSTYVSSAPVVLGQIEQEPDARSRDCSIPSGGSPSAMVQTNFARPRHMGNPNPSSPGNTHQTAQQVDTPPKQLNMPSRTGSGRPMLALASFAMLTACIYLLRENAVLLQDSLLGQNPSCSRNLLSANRTNAHWMTAVWCGLEGSAIPYPSFLSPLALVTELPPARWLIWPS
eukprot:scaffold153924_cov37-Tisochrysis_lutea.AAC.1